MYRNWLYFGDLHPIFKVRVGLRLLVNGLAAPYLLKEWIDFDLTCTSILLWHGKELIRFWYLDPIFTLGLRLLDNGLSACYLLNEWMDFDQTCTAILLRQRQELIRFFMNLIPFSRLHKNYDIRKWLVSTLSHWGMDEFWPNLHIGILWPWVYCR